MLTSPAPAAVAQPFGLASSESAAAPSLFRVVKDYMERVLPSDTSMKVLLVDESTLQTISMSYSQTALLGKGVFLVDQITSHRQRNRMKNMRCIMFIRPEAASVEAACMELQTAKYVSYSIVFCGAASPEYLDRLARADVDQLVNHVEEVFCDFEAVNNDTFLMESYRHGEDRRLAEGLAAMMVAQRRRPHVRFQASSRFARRVATQLVEIVRSDPELYDYRSRDTVLLIVDRNDDPLTPLLTPWTYQAMLHEHIGLRHNTLRLPPDVKGAEEDGYVFSQQDDLFFSANMFNNWGDLCNNVKAYVDKCKVALNLDRSTATMEEIKEFMQRMPQTKSLASSVTKHATVTTYLSSLIQQRRLLEVSLLEQDMVASSNQSDHWKRLSSIMMESGVPPANLVRLCLIYHLKYETAGQPSKTLALLDVAPGSSTATSTEGVAPSPMTLLRNLRTFYGTNRPTERLFAETGVMATIVKTFADAGNIYTQHEPVLKRTLLQLFSGRLDQEQYPYISPPPQANAQPTTSLQAPAYKPREAIVFMCGGATFEEAALVHSVNSQMAYKPAEAAGFLGGGVHVMLGGDQMLNSEQFMSNLASQ